VGPTSETIARLGDKLAARRLAREIGVPVVRGTLEPVPVDRAADMPDLIEEAQGIGFPLLVKAAAGGGGRGMRRVERPVDLPAALVAGSAEARSAFGDGAVYLEREVRPARHVEVQLLGDRHGTVLAVGERDCSVQRRHQKLVEEAPAPGLGPKERVALHDAAVRLGRAAGLTNAATVEFLVDGDGQSWFLEVNTRLQVEHGVTELVADVDIVREQLHVAAGRPLSPRARAAAASAAKPTRHALEVRLSAEDPGQAFAPAPGRVGRWSMPSGPGVRVDTAIEPGAWIPPDYDPLLAKIIVVDEDRPLAIERLARALDEVDVTGIQTTLPFDRWLLRDPAFRAANLSTELVAERWEPISGDERRRALEVAAAVAAGLSTPAAGDRPGRPGPEWSPTSGWRTEGRAAAVDRWPR